MAQSILTLMLVSVTAYFSSVTTNISSPPASEPGTVREVNTDISDVLSGSTACDFVYGFDIQKIFGTESDVIGEETIKVEKLSTCAYHWLNTSNGTEEHLDLWIEVRSDNSEQKFSQDLQKTLENGELRHPMKPDKGTISYELVEGPGDMTIWSSEERAIKWHLGDNFYFIMNLDESRSPRTPDTDLKCLIKLADQINQRLGI